MMIILLLVFSLILLLISTSRFVGNRYPPGPNIFQNLANFSELSKNPHVVLRNLAKMTYGPLMSFRLGFQFVVVASSPDIAKEILHTQNRVFSGRYLPSIHYNVPGVAQASIAASKECDTKWKFLRCLSQRQIFSPVRIQSSAGTMDKCMEMVGLLRDKNCGKIVEIEHIASVTFVNITSNILVSRDMFDLGTEGESNQMLMSYINGLAENFINLGVGDLFPLLKGWDIWTKLRARKSYQMAKLIWSDILQQRRVSRKIHTRKCSSDFLDVMIENSFTDDQMIALLTELLTAGTESTAAVVVWMMAELIKNQEILHKVAEEIQSQEIERSSNEINESLLSNCKYFQACIKETLRLHIPSPFIVPRRATEACKVNGYAIPKDSVIIVNAWAIHTDNDLWDDATTFKPERFLNSKIDFKSPDFRYIPFGAGSRMCPGSGVALAGLQLMVACLVYYFDWSLPDGQDPRDMDTSERSLISLRKDKALCLIPKARERS